jgi:hypothetical protein
VDLGLLISGDERHQRIAEAFVLAGLGDQLLCAAEVRRPVAAFPVRLLDSGTSVRPGRAARLRGRVLARQVRRSRPA